MRRSGIRRAPRSEPGAPPRRERAQRAANAPAPNEAPPFLNDSARAGEGEGRGVTGGPPGGGGSSGAAGASGDHQRSTSRPAWITSAAAKREAREGASGAPPDWPPAKPPSIDHGQPGQRQQAASREAAARASPQECPSAATRRAAQQPEPGGSRQSAGQRISRDHGSNRARRSAKRARAAAPSRAGGSEAAGGSARAGPFRVSHAHAHAHARQSVKVSQSVQDMKQGL